MLADELKSISISVKENFGTLSQELNRKPSPGRWSIAQCLEHIIVSNETYIPLLEQVIKGTYKNTLWEKINPLTGYTGKKMAASLGAVVTRKFISPKLFLPAAKNVSTDIIERFLLHQEKLIKIFSSLEKKEFDKNKITSPVASLVTLYVPDVLKIITEHEKRHVNQAMQVKNDLKIF
jgi:hypothetical protein